MGQGNKGRERKGQLENAKNSCQSQMMSQDKGQGNFRGNVKGNKVSYSKKEKCTKNHRDGDEESLGSRNVDSYKCISSSQK